MTVTDATETVRVSGHRKTVTETVRVSVPQTVPGTGTDTENAAGFCGTGHAQ
jgi:hypothetical protein